MPPASAAVFVEAPPSCFASVDFLPLGDGTYKAVPRKPIQVASVSVAMKLASLERKIILRLYRAGFIEGTQVSPKKILIYMATLYAHMEAAKDEEFWTRERKQRYDATR